MAVTVKNSYLSLPGPWQQRLIAIIGAIAYWLLISRFSQLHFGHIFIGTLTLILLLGGQKLEKWRALLLPLLLTSIVYDSQRLYSDILRGPIHVAEPYQFDLRFFGIRSGLTLLTPNEWWQLHLHPVLDFLCGIAYIFFIPEFFLVAAYYLFFLGKRESELTRKMTWDFFWLNVLGYSTYYWYAAAPPWYVATHGFGPADLLTQASLAGCVRFDQLVGLPIFKNFYGQSADVFGAIPSLHVAYPFLAVIYAFRTGRLKAWSILFYFWVSFSAIYLNHHYVIDVLWGTVYAILIAGPLRYFFARVPNLLRRPDKLPNPGY